MAKNLAFGLIADGNRRWAQSQNLRVSAGHKQGFSVVKDIVLPSLYDHPDWDTLVVYGFSTENWKRSPTEVADLMKLYLQMAEEWPIEIREKKICFTHAGRKDRLPSPLIKKLAALQAETKDNKNFNLVLCLDYGSQDEIERAVALGGTDFKSHLEVPPLDLILRTGGEHRLSNFCLWQAAYAEFCFVDTFLPEFTKKELEVTLQDYDHRFKRKGR